MYLVPGIIGVTEHHVADQCVFPSDDRSFPPTSIYIRDCFENYDSRNFSSVNFQSCQQRYMIYGLAECRDGSRYLGLTDYFNSAGHRGIFTAIESHTGGIKSILCGGEILLEVRNKGSNHAPWQSRMRVAKVNQTSGYIHGLMTSGAMYVSNEISYMHRILNGQSNLFVSDDQTEFQNFNPAIGQNHIHPLFSGSKENLRHEMNNVLQALMFYSYKHRKIDPEMLGVFREMVAEDQMNLELVVLFEKVLQILEYYENKNPLAKIKWQSLRNHMSSLIQDVFPYVDRTLQFLDSLKGKSVESSASLSFFYDLDRMLHYINGIEDMESQGCGLVTLVKIANSQSDEEYIDFNMDR